MNINFKSLKMENFMSYQYAELALDTKGFVLVTGTNNNPIDNAKSNGTGKSSIFSAISWALTGLTTQGGKEVANIFLEGTTKVELLFTVDNNEYQLVRTKNPSNLKIYINGEDKSGKGIRDTEKLLSEYLPDLTHTLLNSVIILGQGLPQKFTNNTPSGRKEVLEKLSNSDFMITDLKTRVAARANFLKQTLRETENKVLVATTEEQFVNAQIGALMSQLDAFSPEEYQLLQDSQQTHIQSQTSLTQELNQLSTSIADVETRINLLQDKLNSASTTFKNTVLDSIEKELLNAEIQVSNINIDIKNTTNEIRKLESVTDICPTCGQKLPNVHKIDTTELHKKLEDLTSSLDTANKQKQAKLLEKQNAQNTFNDEQSQDMQSLFDLQIELKHQNNERVSLNNTLTSINLELKSIETSIQTFNEQKKSLQDKITEQQGKLNDLQTDILCYNKSIEKLNSQLEINSKMNSMLSRDFRGYLLTNIIDFISNQAKQYTQELFGTDKLDFNLDGNNICIMYDTKDYEVLSGGEQQKIDVILQLAIRDMLCKYLNFSSNILVLDEITDSLDIIGSQKMFNLISSKLSDVETIYIISHHQDDFEIPYDAKIEIVKGVDKISRIIQ